MSNIATAQFNFYGFVVRASAALAERVDDIRFDFSYFSTEQDNAPADLAIHFHSDSERPPLPSVAASLHTPRNIVFRDGDTSYLDYGGRGLAVNTQKGKHFDIYCDDRDLAHEIAFLTVLSFLGSHLDRAGLVRVHALGVEANGKAALLLLPSSGGKTTMALRMLESDGIRLLSEDSPLMSPKGVIKPFPIRIGLRKSTIPPSVPETMRLDILRMEFGPKTLVDIMAFKDRLAKECPVGAILLGKRFSGGASSITQLPRSAALRPFLSDAVVGVGLYQGVEFVLKSSPFELLGMSGLALRRLQRSLGVIRRSSVHRFAMGPDIDQTADVLRSFLQSM